MSLFNKDARENQLGASLADIAPIQLYNYFTLVVNNDWAPAINKAIQDANANGAKRVVFSSATYLINSPILHNVPGSYVKLEGQGLRNTIIKANASMTSMLILSDATGYHGNKIVEGITFNGNLLATNGIDASYLRYSTIKENEFTYLAPNGYAIKCGNWTVRILNNIINGQDGTGTNIPSSNGIQVTLSTINNLIIRDNSITCCHIGVEVDGEPNDIHIDYNNFDTCDNAAIWMKLGGRNVTIYHNYFENCGKGTGVTVPKSSSTSETWNGAIILHSDYADAYSIYFENLVIEDNEFANCYTGSLITASGLSKADIKNNHVLAGYSYTYCVNLKWVGCSYIFANRIFIEVNEVAANQFTAPVGLNTDNNKQNTTGLVIRHYQFKDGYTKAPFSNGFELTTPENWNDTDGANFISGAWTVNANGLYEGVFPIRQLAATSNSKYKIIDLTQDYNQFLRGRYLRFNVLSKGDTASNGLWIQVYIDGVNVLDVNNPSQGTFANTTLSPLLYIPTTANQLVFRVHSVSGSSTVSYTKFNISLASKEPENLTFVTQQ